MPFFADQLVPKQKLREGDRAHFECRVVPPNTNQVEWLHNGKLLAMGHRYKTMYDFGYISLDILYVYPEDTGTYVCRATNDAGRSCETQSQLSVEARQKIIHETQCPGGMERLQYDAAGLEHFQYNYQTSRSDGFTDTNSANTSGSKNEQEMINQDQITTRYNPDSLPLTIETPMVTMPLVGTQRVIEGESIHMECRIEPVNDARIKIEYYHNNKSLIAASRYHTMSDFGYVSLDIKHATPEDSGIYTILAHNPAINQNMQNKSLKSNRSQHKTTTGTGDRCETSLKVYVVPVSGVQTQTMHMEALAKLQRLEMGSSRISKNINQQIDDDYDPNCLEEDQYYNKRTTFQRPVFTKPITPDSVYAHENDTSVEFQCRLIPISDPNLRIDWFHNNKPLQASSRLKIKHEFGVVSLRITKLDHDDSGIYQCRAKNQLGETISTGKLRVDCEARVQTESLNPDGLEQIRLLEQPKEFIQPEEIIKKEPARFLTHLNYGHHKNTTTADGKIILQRHEGESLHLQAQVTPSDDAKLKVDWYFNGRPIVTGSRVHTLEDFGYVYLEFDYLYGRDSGEYKCLVSNNHGQDESSIVLKITSDKSIITESQLPEPISADRLRQLEFPDAVEEILDIKPIEPAKFIQQLMSPEPNLLDEGANVHFECRVIPNDDSDLQVEWYHNQQPLISGHRHKPNFNFGLVTLDILHVYPEDSGIYRCLATNKTGQDMTEAQFRVKGQSSLVEESQLPEDMRAGYERLYQMEASWNKDNNNHDYDDDDKEVDEKFRISGQKLNKMPPEFILKPKPVVAFENSCARFCCRIASYPPARLTWIVNGEVAVTSSRFKVYYDGMYHLEIPRCKLSDQGQIKVHAKNILGECLCQTELNIKPKMGDYRQVLKNSPKTGYDQQSLKIYQQERGNSGETSGDNLGDKTRSVSRTTPSPISKLSKLSELPVPNTEANNKSLASTPNEDLTDLKQRADRSAEEQQIRAHLSKSPVAQIVEETNTNKTLDAAQQSNIASEDKQQDNNDTGTAPVILQAPVVKDKTFGMAPAPSTIKRALFLKNKTISLTPPPDSPPARSPSPSNAVAAINTNNSKKTKSKKTTKSSAKKQTKK